MRKYNIAIVGATGAVGEVLLEVLKEREFPVDNLYAVASSRSAGDTVLFGNKKITVQDIDEFDFSQVDIAFFSAGGSVSEKYAPIAADAGAVVIDNTSAFRYEPDVPLIVPEVNPEAIEHFRERNIIANPNCSTIQMVVALKPIHDEVGVARVNVATYQAVSGAGKKAVTELVEQTTALLQGQQAKAEVFDRQIAFNVIPAIDVFQDNGYTKEEMKMHWETQKILGDDRIGVNATAVRVPVFYGHSEALHIETMQPITAEEVTALLKAAPGIEVFEHDADFPTAMSHAVSQDHVFVGRIRQDITSDHGINMWVVADNIRKGAATNAVQIAQLLIERELI